MRITVERPLQLRWEVSEETIAAVLSSKAVQKLDDAVRASLSSVLESHDGLRTTTEKELKDRIGADLADLDLPAAAAKATWATLAVRDESAPPVTDRKGNPKPDPELRDSETVPLPAEPVLFEEDLSDRVRALPYRTAVDDYMRDEVLPYVPDAWVDHEKTKIGYEIPLTRHFYRYVAPRPLEEIDAEIKALEDEIQGLLGEVTR